MAKRPVFVPDTLSGQCVREVLVDFEWYPGFAVSQKQKSIASLHQRAATAIGPGPYLEVSSKSPEPIGNQLSAFNLEVEGFASHKIAVENAFQGSKVFEDGRGPFRQLYVMPPRDAKRHPLVREAPRVKEFRTPNAIWPNHPKTAFYDWVYVKALTGTPKLLSALRQYSGFTDIEFNPVRSINCQARSAALATSLDRRGLLNQAMADQNAFIRICYHDPRPQQSLL